MQVILLLSALLLSVPAYADDPMPDVFAVAPVKADVLMLDVFSCGEGTAGPLLTLDVFSVGHVVASKPADVPSPAVPVAPKPKQQIAPQVIQYAAPSCRYVWTRFGWMQVCQ